MKHNYQELRNILYSPDPHVDRVKKAKQWLKNSQKKLQQHKKNERKPIMKPNLKIFREKYTNHMTNQAEKYIRNLIEELRQLKKEDCFDIPIDSILGENT